MKRAVSLLSRFDSYSSGLCMMQTVSAFAEEKKVVKYSISLTIRSRWTPR